MLWITLYLLCLPDLEQVLTHLHTKYPSICPNNRLKKYPILTWGVANCILSIIGPGHNPEIPQPIPNKMDPNINKTVIFLLFVGKWNVLSFKGCFSLFLINWKAIKLKHTQPTNTINREGSHCESNVRNPLIFCLETMPDTMSPKPKVIPTKMNIKTSFMYCALFLNSVLSDNLFRLTNQVINL